MAVVDLMLKVSPLVIESPLAGESRSGLQLTTDTPVSWKGKETVVDWSIRGLVFGIAAVSVSHDGRTSSGPRYLGCVNFLRLDVWYQ